MSKGIKFIMAFVIMIIALPFGANVVNANEGNNSDLIKPDKVFEVEFNSESRSLNSNFENPVILLEKDDQKYIQINGNSGQYFSSLSANGSDVIWGEITSEGAFTIQFEIDSLSDEVLFDMIIDPGFMPPMFHGDIGLTFDEATKNELPVDSNNIYKNGVDNPFIKEIVGLKTPIEVNNGKTIIIENDLSTQLTMPEDLPSNVKLTVEPIVNDETLSEDLELAGKVYNFNFSNIGDYSGEFELVMTYDKDKYEADQVDIYYYDESKEEWIAQNGVAKDGKVTVKVNHFSTYGVLATSKKEEAAEETKQSDSLKPDKAFEIDFNIMQEDGSAPSISNDFFKKPAYLFEKDGNKYIQLTIENGEMIKAFSNKYGNALIVKENDDGSSILQLRVNNDLSDMELDMHIIVPEGAFPGFPGYNEKHGAILVFDKDSKKEIEIGGHMLIGTNNPENENGPFVEDGSSNELGEGNDDEEKKVEDTNTNPDKDLNPKTGDTNNIGFYVFLLASSLISLGFLVRKRRFN